MLPRQFLSVSIALMTLLVAAVPFAAALPNECQLMPNADPANGRVGRPCVTLHLEVHSQTGEATCASFEHTWLKFDRDPICTFYLMLVPIADGGTIGAELDTLILYGETNNAAGLQTVPIGSIPEDAGLIV